MVGNLLGVVLPLFERGVLLEISSFTGPGLTATFFWEIVVSVELSVKQFLGIEVGISVKLALQFSEEQSMTVGVVILLSDKVLLDGFDGFWNIGCTTSAVDDFGSIFDFGVSKLDLVVAAWVFSNGKADGVIVLETEES